MGMPVVVVPGLLVAVGGILRGDLLEEGFQIVLHQAGLELGGGDAGGGADDEEGGDAVGEARVLKNLPQVGREVQHLAVPAGLDLNAMGFDAHASIVTIRRSNAYRRRIAGRETERERNITKSGGGLQAAEHGQGAQPVTASTCCDQRDRAMSRVGYDKQYYIIIE